jgi:diamine N-acetyltransferase
MLEIRKSELEKDLDAIHKIIQLSNITVADDFKLTKENAPTSPAYIELDKVKESFDIGVDYYIGIYNENKVGCVAIESDKNNPENFFIERLAVLPEFRYKKIGKRLLDNSISEIKKRNGKSAGIAIINENERLKNWYINYGFSEDRIKKFDHLPFTVCFMSLTI